MEEVAVEGIVFIGVAIIAVTQFIKFLAPNVSGAWTILVSAVVGLLVAMFDTQIGVTDLSIAEGIMAGFSASGVVTVARNIQGRSE